MTLGGRLEGELGLLSGGASFDVLLPFGFASLSAAASGSKRGAGFAGAARYAYATRKFSVSAMVQVLSDRYETLSLPAERTRNTVEARLSTMAAASPRFSFGANYWMTLCRDELSYVRVGGLMRVQLTRDLQLTGSATYTLFDGFSSASEATLSLMYTFGSVTALGSGTYSGRGFEGNAAVNKPITEATGFGYRASATYAEEPRGDAMVTYQGTHGRYQASASLDRNGPHLALETSGAIVAVAGAGVFATIPVQNGFAVAQVPGVKGVRVYLENREIGKTDADGNVLIPNMLPYYGSKIGIADEDLPLDYTVGATEIRLAPPFRTGGLAVFSAKRDKYYRGRLVIEKGGVKKPAGYGDLWVTQGGKTLSSPLGKAGEFEIANLEPGRHQARIEADAGICVFRIEAPDREGAIIDLGSLTCVVEEGVEKK